MRVLDPVAAINPAPVGKPWRMLETLTGKRVGLLRGLKSEDSAISMFPAGSHEQIYVGVGQQTLENNLFVIAARW